MPKTSDAMLKAINKYHKEKIDELKIRVPKGKKEELQTHAHEQGESLNGFVNRAINEAVKRDKESNYINDNKTVPDTPETTPSTSPPVQSKQQTEDEIDHFPEQ